MPSTVLIVKDNKNNQNVVLGFKDVKKSSFLELTLALWQTANILNDRNSLKS